MPENRFKGVGITQCVATARHSGMQCRNSAIPPTDKCKYHGGTRPGLKHGLSSKYGPPKVLLDRIRELENDPRIMDHRHLAAHLYAVMEKVHEKIEESEGLTYEDIEVLRPLLEALRKTATDYHRLVHDRRYVDVLEAQKFIGQALHRVLRHVAEEARAKALEDVEALLGQAEPQTPETLLPRGTDSNLPPRLQ